VTALTFRLPGEVDLPVEVFDTELRLVGRVLSSGSVSVEPGTYFVEAREPDGARLQQTVKIGEDRESRVVRLQRERAVFGLQAHGTPTIAARRRETMAFGRALDHTRVAHDRVMWPAATLLTFRLSWTGGWQVASSRRVRADMGLVDVGEADAVGLQRRDGTTLVIPAPGRSTSLMRFRIDRNANGEADLDARLDHDAADALLRYLSADLLDDARLMADGRALEGERLLSTKVEDPLAAAAGALALLRMNELDRLHHWTANLAKWFTWLPDGAAIRAEHLGRIGQHEEAAELLRELPLRGIPVLSFGLMLAVDRLRTYAARWPEDAALDNALAWLTRVALATDSSDPITAFAAGGPDSPEAARPSESRGSDGPEAAEGRREHAPESYS
jgi:hypothetical protein